MKTMKRKLILIGVLGVLYLAVCRSSYMPRRHRLNADAVTTQHKAREVHHASSTTNETLGRADEIAMLSIEDAERNSTAWGTNGIVLKNGRGEMRINIDGSDEPYLNRWQRRFSSSEARGKEGGYLFFRHTRKAGGTSLRDYFRDVLRYHNITRTLQDYKLAKTKEEGRYQIHYIEHEFQPMDWKCPAVDPRWRESIRVIVFRHPVERHLSEFFFSGPGNTFPIDKGSLYLNKTYTDELKTKLGKALPWWMKGKGNFHKRDNIEGKLNMIFSRHYTDNFQLRALAGCSSGNCLKKREISEEDMEKINKYHPTSYSYSTPVSRCTHYFRKETSSALFETCAKTGHVKDECSTLGCDGPCFYPSVGWGPVDKKDLIRAVTLLKSFDAVLLMEKLDDPDQADFLSDIMSVPRDASFSLARRNTTSNAGVTKSDNREKTHFYRDLLLNLGLNDVYNSLLEENKLEIELFDHAVKINSVMLEQWKKEAVGMNV